MKILTRQARETIKNYWVVGPKGAQRLTIAGYVRHEGYKTAESWGGDRCGCPDARCIGFHHYDATDCGCLPVLLDQYAQEIATGVRTITCAGGEL